MKRIMVLAGLGLALLVSMPHQAKASALHYFDCKECHKAGVSVTAISGTNLCLTCHETASTFTDSSPVPAPGYDGISDGKFSALEGSNLFGSNSVGGTKTGKSHMWGVPDVKAEAGAKAPNRTLYAGFYSRYNSSLNRVTCSRCHDPHGEADMGTGNLLANPKLLVRDQTTANAPIAVDKMCRACHVDFDKTVGSPFNTHPIVPDYAAVQAVKSSQYKTVAAVAAAPGASKAQLVDGGVGCTSCHGVHYVDSDSTTADGLANRPGLNDVPGGLGELLRSDSPLRSGGTRNGAAGTAQLRSNLCQTCHTYKMHGKGAVGDAQVGCLECHNAHDYSSSSPYGLRTGNSLTALPTRVDSVNQAPSTVDFGTYPSGPFTRSKWSDNVEGTATGYCERCHGDVEDTGTNGVGLIELEHQENSINACTACHKHNDPASLHSFNIDANAATCGQCHGFPPYLNVRGDVGNDPDGAGPGAPLGTLGGYAYNYVDLPAYDYSGRSYFKNEAQTAHKTHAGADLPTNPGTWYFVGTAGIENCMPCHGNSAGTGGGGHRIAPGTDANTFRNVNFNQFGTDNGNYSPSFNTTTNKCDNTYCHSNGAPRTGDSTRDYTVVSTTPAWVGNGTTDGFNSIQGKANRCQFCHGNDATSMGAAQKKASPAHLVHLNKGYTCDVCHVETAASNTALIPNATDGRTGGEHINLVADVHYQTSGGALYTALGVNTNGPTYNTTTGTCAIYCHDPADTGITADWDSAVAMQCDTCHGGLTSDTSANGGLGPITSSSHPRHISDSVGPLLSCDECHGAGATAGTHSGHIDGLATRKPPVDGVTFANICDECHGYDGGAGEVLPVWGNASTTDCYTCHGGSQTGANINGFGPDAFPNALTSGHNRPTASGAYGVSANPAANKACTSCHDANAIGHFGGGYDKRLLAGVNCATCHGVGGSAVNNNLNAHVGKNCEACHDPHGTGNIFMIHDDESVQRSYDGSGTGEYAGFVTFTALTGADSYDEDDGAAGGAGEVNADDLCATCHTVAGGTTHNNSNNSAVTHGQGGNCFTCHTAHTDANPFAFGAGTACNDCHGFPPATAAHSKHAKSASNDKDVEDRTDCAFCHTGADLYTYDLGADQAAGGARGNHAVSQANRRAVLTTAVGFNTTNLNCTTACHASTAADGAWNDVNGLNCNACHYASASPTGANNTAAGSRAVSAVHNKHFDKNSMTCAQCHDVSYSPSITAVVGPLAHINDTSGANEGLQYQGMAQALVDEAAVVRSGMTFNDPNNTCSGGIGLGCHASGTPDWDVTIPATSAGCVMCHTETNTAAYNPVSGIHDNSPSGPTVTGNSHDGSFDDGNSGTADCVTCHTASPTGTPANHINGTLNTGSAITVAAIAGYSVATADCATTCHSAGTTWRYKWSTTAYATNGSECGNCHGDYATGWITGVAPHTENPTRGNKHNNVGTLTYPCTDCHAIGSASGYNWTSKWDPAGVTSNHGDDKITMNQVAGTNTFAIDTAPNPDRAGCTTASCHGNDAAHNFRITTTSFTTQTVTGNAPSILCSSCHGGYVGTSANGYWPDGANAVDNGVEDNSGAHQKHMTVLAQAKYGETLAQLLTNNGNGTADAKQKFLCAYCHTNPGADGDHGILANLPAEVNSMYAQWDLTQSTADNGVWSSAAKTCATVDCHFNKTTPTSPTSYTWYSGSASACIMCHVDVTTEAKHVAHTGAAATFGRAIGCADCHDAATNWGTNTAPASGHLNNSYSIAGSVAFTYASFSCGTNDCHEDGKGGAPKTNPYPWNGGALGNCTICHDASPTTDAHPAHNAAKVVSYVAGCSDCHPAASNSAHINNSVSYASKLTAAPGNGSCTNTCHLSPQAGDWTGGSAAIACADCHSGSGASAYIGGDKSGVAGPNYMPQYNMHLTVPTVSGKVHTDTGLSTTCQFCHSTMGSYAATHPNGVWAADDADNTNDQNRGMFAAFTDGSPATCATSCHSAGTAWRYKWSATAGATNGTQCDNCHGVYGTWTTGVGHTESASRGNGAHTEAGNGGFPCTDCHSFGTTNGAYTYTVTTNDWAATDGGATTKHGDGFITVNSTSTSWARSGSRSGCSACHEGATGSANAHDFPASALTSQSVAGDAPNVSGGCTTCHGNSGSGEFAPDGSTYPDRAGQHWAHISAIALKMGADNQTNRNASCDYCHPNPGAGGHNDNVTPADLHSTGNFRYIIGGSTDIGSTYASPSADTCASIACHGNAPSTPHWYADTVAPAAVGNLAVTNVGADVKPGTLKLTWTAPGNDGSLDGKAYEYDVRYSTGAISAGNFAAATRAGNAPSVQRLGKTQTMHLEGLTPGTSYYVAVKTRDEADNWSAISNLPAAVAAKADTVAPIFYGIGSATPGDETGTVKLRWDKAVDTSLPLTYNIWWSTGTITYGAPNATTKGLSYRVTGLPVGVLYNFAVRAVDNAAAPNTDTNIFTKSAMAETTPIESIDYTQYFAGGPVTSPVLGAAYGSAVTTSTVTAGTVTVFAHSTSYAVKTNVSGLSFDFYVNESARTSGQQISYWLGYMTGSTFYCLDGSSPTSGNAGTLSIARRSARMRKLPLNAFSGAVPAGSRIALRVQNSGANSLDYRFGNTTYKGILAVNEQVYNDLPNTFAVTTPSGNGLVNLTWGATTDPNGDTVHYDVYGSDDNGATWKYIIDSNLDTPGTTWNTRNAGIGLLSANSQVRVRVDAGDGKQIGSGAGTSHATVTSAAWTVNNTTDAIGPAAVADLAVETRPKQGTVYLTWTAPGGDGDDGRAQVYDVRYSTSAINAGNFAAATQAPAAPYPALAGEPEGFEIVGLNTDTPYWFAVKASDGTNWSAISNVVSANSGKKCGICHATPPDESAVAGNHIKHGYTINDCAKCHGDAAASYDLDHQDGQLVFGFGRDAGGTRLAPVTATVAGSNVSYWQDPDGGGALPAVKIYEDTTGAGGFNVTTGDGVDNGTCMNFNGVNGSGCHGPAAPSWNEAATLACSACHGTLSRTTDGFGRKYDDVMINGSANKVIASPPVDNHGLSTGKYVGQHEKHLNFSFRFAKGDSCRLCHKNNDHADNTIDIQLDLDAAGDLADWTPEATGAGTPGTCFGTSQLTCHGESVTVTWDSAQTFYCNNCHGMNGKAYTIGSGSSAIGHVMDGGQVRACTWCHVAGHPQERPVLAVTKAATATVTTANNHGLTSGDSIVMHVPNGMTQLDGWTGTVTVTGATTFTIPVNTSAYGNFTSGFWTLGVDAGTLLIPNNPAVGINYRSGGIHLLKTINGRGPYTTEAEICWGCHDAQSTKVSEWGQNNNATTGASPYNYGLINNATTTAKWYATATTGASWTSGTTAFSYKTGAIRSTHSTNPDGSSAVTGSDYAKTETVDPVQKIRCSNCHDVHDRNLAKNDTMSGQPFLRGTWMGNPYNEDGAPQSGTTYVNVAIGSYGFGAVPRGGTGYRRLGGYYIDQNNSVPGTPTTTSNGTADDYPTTGWTLQSSAGLCTLCHGSDVDNMDQTTGENLWMGTNGHSNSALGGTFVNATNIFDYGAGTASISGRPVPVITTSVSKTTQVPDMAYQTQPTGSTTRGYGYRGTTGGSNAGGYTPVTQTLYAYNAYDWGATVDDTTIDVMFHQFSCSKCHNPHASRLPKLLITNCLDIKKNTWDDNKSVQSQYTASTLTDVDRFGGTGQRPAYYASAQNCHRYNNLRTAVNKGGWNKVSPW